MATQADAGKGLRIATDATPHVSPGGGSPLVNRIRQAGGKLEASRGTITAKDLATASHASGNEIALYRDRVTRNRIAIELGPTGGEIPSNVRLILHVQPGEGPLSVIPSAIDRATLRELGQRSSVIINSAGDYSIRFGTTNQLDQPVRPIGPKR